MRLDKQKDKEDNENMAFIEPKCSCNVDLALETLGELYKLGSILGFGNEYEEIISKNIQERTETEKGKSIVNK